MRRLLFLSLAVGVTAILASPVLAGDMQDKNKALFTEFVDTVMNQGKVDMIDTYLAEGFVEHEVMPPGIPEGREGCKQFFTMFREAFPDLHVTIDDLLADGDKVVARQTWTATHQGEFMGMPASKNKVEFTVIDIVRMKDGKAVDHWGAYDSTTMMMQMNPENYEEIGPGVIGEITGFRAGPVPQAGTRPRAPPALASRDVHLLRWRDGSLGLLMSEPGRESVSSHRRVSAQPASVLSWPWPFTDLMKRGDHEREDPPEEASDPGHIDSSPLVLR